MSFNQPNSANTISLKYKPGENKRLLFGNSEAIFSYGDFKIERNLQSDQVISNFQNLSFSDFSTLETLGSSKFEEDLTITSIKENELNLDLEKPENHSYFSSFYTDVANAVNNIIDNFPYAILSYNNGEENIFNYSETTNSVSALTYSTFSLHLSALTNQGDITINSGNTLNRLSLVNDYEKFCIQLSGGTDCYKINNYNFSSNTLTFTVIGSIFDNPSTSSTQALYIRPTKERISDYYKQLPILETQLLKSSKFYVPNMKDANQKSYLEEFLWPKDLDGFAPDSYGSSFDTYKENLLVAAEKIDEEKTNIFIKTIIPENFLEFDSDRSVFRSIIQTYSNEFDKLKKFIDAIAYAHSINYNNKESVPTKFISKLSSLLGWKLTDSFNELSLFEYLTSDLDGENNSYSYFNVEIWKRILVNISWLYKKKGTRDALMFIFKLLGAPDCLVNFNEFVYDIERVVTTLPNMTIPSLQANILSNNNTLVVFNTSTNLQPNFNQINFNNLQTYSPISTAQNNNVFVNGSNTYSSSTVQSLNYYLPNSYSEKIDDHGFVNYKASKYVFQEGGTGRGNGQNYINQWKPEFDPKLRIDNVKIQTGNTNINIGTKSIMNTKEVELYYSPSKAVECDVFSFYQNDCSCWNWGSTCPAFSSLTVPFEYLSFDCSVASPTNITAMTLSQYIDYMFTNAVNPKNRKTSSQLHNTWHYPELKNIYMNYYLSTNPEGNHLTMGKLEAYLNLIGGYVGDYLEQLIPATTILKGMGSIVYKNPVFHRQKFVYKEGVHEGSMFRSEMPQVAEPVIKPCKYDLNIIEEVKGELKPCYITTTVNSSVSSSISTCKITMSVNQNSVSQTIESWDITTQANDNITDQLVNIL